MPEDSWMADLIDKLNMWCTSHFPQFYPIVSITAMTTYNINVYFVKWNGWDQGWVRVHGKVLEYKYMFYEYKYEYLFYQCTQVWVHFKVFEYKYEYIFNHIYSNLTTM